MELFDGDIEVVDLGCEVGPHPRADPFGQRFDQVNAHGEDLAADGVQVAVVEGGAEPVAERGGRRSEAAREVDDELPPRSASSGWTPWGAWKRTSRRPTVSI